MSENPSGGARGLGHGISFAADNLLQLRSIEIDGHLERGIGVLGARGVGHASEVRRLTIGADGGAVGGPFEGMSRVLTGLPTAPLAAP